MISNDFLKKVILSDISYEVREDAIDLMSGKDTHQTKTDFLIDVIAQPNTPVSIRKEAAFLIVSVMKKLCHIGNVKVSPEAYAEIVKCYPERKIQAIKAFRDDVGYSLEDSKNIINEYWAERGAKETEKVTVVT